MNFSIFKNKFKKPDTNEPDFSISSKDEQGNFVKIGAGWYKETKSGDKYISCKIDSPNANSTLTDVDKENIRLAKEKEMRAKAKNDII